MDTERDADTIKAALIAAAELAGLAPSIHNTQPWRWRVATPTLELRAARERQLEFTDPYGHLLLVSCGAALHHATTALAAEGWRAEVRRMPDRDDPDLLAAITVTGHAGASAEAMHAVQTLRIRRTDRRPVSAEAVPAQAIASVVEAAAMAGASLHILKSDDVIELAAAADRAQTIELSDPEWLQELDYWAGGARQEGSGIPDTVIPEEPVQSTVPSRNFGHGGSLPISAGHDGAAVYGILFGQDNTPAGWLRAGEALSAAWVAAIEHGLCVVPMSAAVEIEITRQSMRRILANVAEPYLAIRLGSPDPDQPGPAHTPRLPVDQVLEIVP